MIKFLLDMGVSPICSNWLHENGHDSIHLNDLKQNKLPDSEIITFAKLQNRVILTCDNDFGTLMALGKFTSPSVILFRLDDYRPNNICKKLSIILSDIPTLQILEGVFITVKENKYRIRRLPMLL